MVLGLFSGKTRALRNGAQETIEVRTQPDEVNAPLWFADCYLVAKAFSEGDRSAILAALQSTKQAEAPALMTAGGSVTHELYERFTQFGYMERVPSAIPGDFGQWAVRPDQHALLLGCFAASHVDSLTRTDLERVSKGFAVHRAMFDKMNTKLLRMMRDPLLRVDQPFADGGIQAREFKAMAKLKLIYTADGTWRPTRLGTMVLPYFFDHLLNRKRLWLEEQNR